MDDKLTIIIKESELPEGEQLAIKSGFEGYEAIAKEWEAKAKQIIVTSADQKDLIAQAKEGRKLLKEKRIEIDKNRKALKEQSLRKGQAIDAIAKYLTSLITPIEDYLESQEKFAEIQEEKRLAELETSRIKELSPFVDDISIYNLKVMSDEAYQGVLKTSKELWQIKQDRLKKEEEERLAREKQEAEAREKMRLENERLRAEQDKLKKEQEEERKKQDEALRKEREEKERLEKELRDKQEAEAKAQREAEQKRLEQEAEAKRLEEEKLKAPDKDKLRDLTNTLLSISYPEMQTEDGKRVIEGVKNLMEKVNVYIVKNIDNL